MRPQELCTNQALSESAFVHGYEVIRDQLTMKGETIELKKSLGEWKEIVQTCAAFATAQGGRLYIGVSDKGDEAWKNQRKLVYIPARMIHSQKVPQPFSGPHEINELRA